MCLVNAATGGATDGHGEPYGDLRVVGIQYLQRLGNVVSYASFCTAIDCLFKRYVVPNEVPGRPTLVVFNEDIGLMTGFIGARGAAARALLSTKAEAPRGDQAPQPVGPLAAIGAVSAAYAPQLAAYQARYGPIPATKGVFVAVTDTFVRAFMETFSDAARSCGVYVVAANSQSPYRESLAAEIATFRDPSVTSGPAYVATSARVTNTAFLWGPVDVHPSAPDGE